MTLESIELDTAIAIVASGSAVVGILVEHFHTIGGLQERIAKVEENQENDPMSKEEFKQMTADISEMKTKIGLFWRALETQLPGLLLKGNPIDPDSRLFKLLERYQSKDLCPDECHELVDLLINEAKRDDHDPGEKTAMVLMTAVVTATIDKCVRVNNV